MPNIPFLEPTSLTVSGIPKTQIGDYGPPTELIITGTLPQEITPSSASNQYAIFSCSNANIYVLRGGVDTVSPSNYSFLIGDGDNFINFELGKQRHTCCANEGEDSKLIVSLAQEEVVII